VSSNSTDPTIGRLIDGRYQVRSRIARGGMATVYLATDLRLERRVAIKIMHGHLADDSQFKERFIQEARSAARLAHPNVVNVFDQGQDRDMAYLVMEFLSGITLRDLLTEHKILTSEQALDILEAVLSGLAAAHKAGIVHRDLKPENVLLADDGRIKIGDFGLARAASANTATGAALLGTIAYLSPELVTRGIADARSDIYAVGIMMYEMLAGEQPFRGEQPMQIAYQHANDSVPTPSTKNPMVPAELDELVLWATARDPEERPRDARVLLEQVLETQKQLRTALPVAATAVQRTAVLPQSFRGTGEQTQVIRSSAPAAAVAPVSDATAALTVQTRRRRSRSAWWVILVLLLAGLAGGTGWYFGVGPGSQVQIPGDIAGATPDAATATLAELGLRVAPETAAAFDPLVPEGNVAATDPSPGSSVDRDSVVTIVISQGPQPVTMPEFAGLTTQAAAELAETNGFTPTSNEVQFADAPADTVLEAFGIDAAGARIPLAAGDTYYDQRPITFRVSAGPVPDVAGLSLDAAIAALQGSGLTGVQGERIYNDSIPADQVVRAEPQVEGATVAPGDTMFLVMSKGPDLVTVPVVRGLFVTSALEALRGAGFTVKVSSNVPEALWNVVVVQDIGPVDQGQSAKRGSQITIESNY
jgi:beta-lactam-binding protein with PASTA domain/tRNA A-37 threonylcarbamoyl transferase component Bud32